MLLEMEIPGPIEIVVVAIVVLILFGHHRPRVSFAAARRLLSASTPAPRPRVGRVHARGAWRSPSVRSLRRPGARGERDR